MTLYEFIQSIELSVLVLFQTCMPIFKRGILKILGPVPKIPSGPPSQRPWFWCAVTKWIIYYLYRIPPQTILNNTHNVQHRSGFVVIKAIAIGTGGLGLIPGLVKLHTVSPTAHHRCDVSSKLSWQGVKQGRWSPLLVTCVSVNTASIINTGTSSILVSFNFSEN